MGKLNWKNLQDHKCPKCSGPLVHNKQIDQHLCEKECGYGGIYGRRFNELVDSIYKTKKKPLLEFEEVDRSNWE